MKVLSLGTLRSQLINNLGIAIPVECQIRLKTIMLGEMGTSLLDSWLYKVLESPVKVDCDISLLPLSLQFRGNIDSQFFVTAALPEIEAAIPVAVVECMLRQAGISGIRTQDILIVGKAHAGQYRLTGGASGWRAIQSLAKSLHAELIGDEGRIVDFGNLIESVFGQDCCYLIKQAFQILLVTRSPRLTGEAVEAYRKLESNLIAGDHFNNSYNELAGIIQESSPFIKFGTHLLKWRADLSEQAQANADAILQSFDQDISPEEQQAYPILLEQFYIDFARYLQDIRGIDSSDTILARIQTLARSLASTAAYPDLIFLVEHRLGRSHYLRGAFAEALQCYQSALSSLDKLSHSDEPLAANAQVRLTHAEIFNSMGKVFTDLLSLRSAMICLSKAAHLRIVLDARYAQAATFGSTAEVLARLGRYSEAETLFLKDLELCEEKDKLRVRNYLGVLKTLTVNLSTVTIVQQEFEIIYAQYMKELDFAQASYAVVGQMMCAFRFSQLGKIEDLWSGWRGQGESLPRGFIIFLYGVSHGRSLNWETALLHIREATDVLQSDAYLMEAAAAQLELLVLAHMYQLRMVPDQDGGEGNIAPQTLPQSLVEDSILNALRLIEEFCTKRQSALEVFSYQLPKDPISSALILPQLFNSPLPKDNEILDGIKAGLMRLHSATGNVKNLDIQLIRDIQKQCHFWFDILGQVGPKVK